MHTLLFILHNLFNILGYVGSILMLISIFKNCQKEFFYIKFDLKDQLNNKEFQENYMIYWLANEKFLTYKIWYFFKIFYHILLHKDSMMILNYRHDFNKSRLPGEGTELDFTT